MGSVQRLHQLTLSVEHRAAASISAVTVQLAIDGDAIALAATAATSTAVDVSPPSTAPPTVEQTIEAQLAAAAKPMPTAALRKLCKIRNAKLTATLANMVAAGRIAKRPNGYVISP